ncbi:MAG: hypothetical protein NVS4B7_18960 [Ktedonobacteraceae bacterium]
MATTEKTNSMSSVTPSKKTEPAKRSASWRIINLVIGDVIAFFVFAFLGRGSHGEATGLAAIPQIFLTAAPFAIAWFIVSPFLGAFRRDLTENPRKMLNRTLLAWICSWPLAMALRGIFVDHGIPPLSFAIVTLIFNTLLLLLWRWPYAFNNSLKKKS